MNIAIYWIRFSYVYRFFSRDEEQKALYRSEKAIREKPEENDDRVCMEISHMRLEKMKLMSTSSRETIHFIILCLWIIFGIRKIEN